MSLHEVRVRANDCPCPGTPHTEEVVYLEPTVTLGMGAAVSLAMKMAGSNIVEKQAAITQTAVLMGIRTWTFTDEQGSVVEKSLETIEELLPWDKGGMTVADQASDLYEDVLIRPLVLATAKSLPDGQTERSTSPTGTSGPKLPAPSRRSSPSGTDGKPSGDPAP